MSSILETPPTTGGFLPDGSPAGGSVAESWSYIDQIYCISLTQRSDRRERAQQEFDRIGLGRRVRFFLVDGHPHDSEQGIFESHLACLRAGLATGAQTILIFEDDVMFRRFSPRVLGQAIRFMKSDPDWHIFFFGCFVWSSKKLPFDSVLRVRYRCTAHAYVVSRPFAEKLVQMHWRGAAYDDLLSNLNDPNFYACYPSFAFQSDSATDNSKLRRIDQARRLVGGLYRLQRWNEFSSRNLRTIVLVHVAVALLLILAIVLYGVLH
jgi:glycosyl transferase, family 25